MRWLARSAAYEAGARWIVLCDTNGGTLPHEIEEIVRRLRTGSRLASRHPCPQRHRAGGGQLAGRRRAGARQIQGTLNGIGERCGNANLVSLIPTLMLKPAYAELFRDRRHRKA
jgi:2-isopropylmalate synthase